jgi:succinate dehydrogenase flavin-adding protein (antitoxin of CptAB toxin-antitoxin module)
LPQQALTANSQNDLARFLAFLSQKDPDLAQVVERWPDLPEYIKTTIKTLVETAGK